MLFVTVTVLENLEAFYRAVHVFNEHPVPRQSAVKALFQFGQRTILSRFERR